MKNEMRVVTMKQQVSKALMSQAKREINDLMHYNDPAVIKRSVAAKLCDSGYHKDGSIRSWEIEGIFNFVFEYGRRGGIRISYCNSNGLQSATFQAGEWESLNHMLQHMVKSAISSIEEKAEAEKKAEEQKRFEDAVAAAVRKELYKQNELKLSGMMVLH